MPKLEPTATLYKVCKPIADKLKAKGLNWSAQASASAVVMFFCKEIADGNITAAEVNSAEFKDERTDWANQLVPIQTAPINFQRTYLAPSGLMDAPKAAAEAVAGEFVE